MTLNLTNPNAAMRVPNEDHRAPCLNRQELFLIATQHAHEAAKEICDTCPFFAWCESERDHTLELRPNSLEGTWAGQLYTDKHRRSATVVEDVA